MQACSRGSPHCSNMPSNRVRLRACAHLCGAQRDGVRLKDGARQLREALPQDRAQLLPAVRLEIHLVRVAHLHKWMVALKKTETLQNLSPLLPCTFFTWRHSLMGGHDDPLSS